MGTNYVAFASPFFFVLIGLELLIARRRGLAIYRTADALTNVACGMMQQLVLVFCKAALLGGYVYVHDHFALLHLPSTPAVWVVAFLALDFLYYAWHWLSHRVNWLWAAHVVHHSSEDFNLSVALRQSVLTPFTIWPFYLLLALAGVPPVVYASLYAFNLLYQFWIHSPLIGRLGWFELVFNTPSQHRVHHAIDARYLDKNYGGTLAVWDRLFGTFEPEGAPPVYGLVHPLRSFHPVWAEVHYVFELGRRCLRTAALRDAMRLIWRSPNAEGTSPPTADTRAKYEPVAPLVRYATIAFLLALAGTMLAMFMSKRLPIAALSGVALFALVAIVSMGFLLEVPGDAEMSPRLRSAVSTSRRTASGKQLER
jgi:sterol desaturase/sphingolipid hydroxylase (fatty acid hydroxylase superfamily)